MALTIKIKSSIEIVGTSIESHQGTALTSVDTPIEVVTQTNIKAQQCVAFTASATVELWNDSNYGLDELTFAWIKSTQDGTIEWKTAAEAANDDVSTVSIRANIPLILFADSTADKLQAMIDHTGADALGTGTLADVTQLRFLDNSGNAGEVEFIGAK